MNGMLEFIIEPAIVSCAEAIAEIEAECFSRPWSRAAVEAEISNRHSVFLVCKVDQKPVGYVNAQLLCPECFIGNLAIQKEYRGRGIAAALLRALISEAKARGCAFVSLEVRVSNTAAISLYEKAGFQKQGERKGFYSKPTENAAIYTLFFPESECI